MKKEFFVRKVDLIVEIICLIASIFFAIGLFIGISDRDDFKVYGSLFLISALFALCGLIVKLVGICIKKRAIKVKYNKRSAKLAQLILEDHEIFRMGPAIRGRKGEAFLSGESIEEVAKNCNMSVKKVESLTIDFSKTVTFGELPPYWQQAIIDLAETYIKLIEPLENSLKCNGKSLITMFLDIKSDIWIECYVIPLHKKWLELPVNAWAIGGPLDVPFRELPGSKQNQLIQQLMSVCAWAGSNAY